MAEAIKLLKKAAASRKIAKQQVMEAIDVLEKAKLDVRAAEQVFWRLLLQHAIYPCLSGCPVVLQNAAHLPLATWPTAVGLAMLKMRCIHTWLPGNAAACN